MVLAVASLALCMVLCTGGALFVLRWYLEAKQRELEARVSAILRDWTEAEPGKPSKLAELVDSAGAVVGSAAARSLLGSLRQENSAVARVANNLGDEVQAQTNPLAALMGGGRRGRGSALMRLAEIIGPMLMGGGKPGASAGDNGNGAQLRLDGASVARRIQEKAR